MRRHWRFRSQLSNIQFFRATNWQSPTIWRFEVNDGSVWSVSMIHFNDFSPQEIKGFMVRWISMEERFGAKRIHSKLAFFFCLQEVESGSCSGHSFEFPNKSRESWYVDIFGVSLGYIVICVIVRWIWIYNWAWTSAFSESGNANLQSLTAPGRLVGRSVVGDFNGWH